MIAAVARMKPGFGPMNIRVTGIVLIAILASLLGITQNAVTAAMGILGGHSPILVQNQRLTKRTVNSKPQTNA